MGSGPSIDKVISPGGKGRVQGDPMANDPFINTYMGGGKGGYTQQPSYQSNYIDPYSQPFRQSPIADPYAGTFQPFTGSYGYQQPMYSPPQQFYSPPQQFYSPPQQYFSPYMNQFQMAGNQFYQQPYSYQPSGYQPFPQMGGRSQYFAQRGKGGFY